VKQMYYSCILACMYLQEVSEMRTRTVTTMDEIDSGIREEYDNKLSDALSTTRTEYEEQIRQVREEVEDLYDRKVSRTLFKFLQSIETL